MKNETNDFKMPKQVQISLTPNFVTTEDVKIEKGQCFINSYRVAKKNNTEIIEGLILVVDKEKKAKAMPHVWNKCGEIHFDVTKEKIWTGKEELDETREIKYFNVKSHNPSDFKNGDILEFSNETYENVKAINDILNNREKNNDQEF